jgi:MFS family permease
MVGLLFATYPVALLTVSPLAGRATGVFGPRVLIASGCLTLACASLGYAAGDSFLSLCVSRGLQGAAAGVIWVAGLSHIAAAAAPENRGRDLASTATASSIGILLGPVLGGVLAAKVHPAAPFVALAVTGAMLGCAAALTLPSHAEPRESESLIAFLRRPSAPAIACVIVAGGAAIGAIEPLLSLHFSVAMSLDSAAIGIRFMGMTATYGAASYLAGEASDRVGEVLVCRVGGVMMATCLGVAAVTPLLGPAFALPVVPWMLATGAAIGVFTAPTLGWLARVAGGEGRYGAAYALYNLVNSIGLIIGPVVGGWVARTTRWEYGLAPFAALSIVAGLMARFAPPVAPPE